MLKADQVQPDARRVLLLLAEHPRGISLASVARRLKLPLGTARDLAAELKLAECALQASPGFWALRATPAVADLVATLRDPAPPAPTGSLEQVLDRISVQRQRAVETVLLAEQARRAISDAYDRACSYLPANHVTRGHLAAALREVGKAAASARDTARRVP